MRGALADSGVGRGACVVHLSTPRGLLVREMDATLTSIREQLLEEVVR